MHERRVYDLDLGADIVKFVLQLGGDQEAVAPERIDADGFGSVIEGSYLGHAQQIPG
jgi:hypothetical protein